MAPYATIPRLATTFGAVTGVTRTFSTLPGSLNASDLPALMFIPQIAEYRILAQGRTVEEREYAMLLYVAPLATNKFGEAHNDCLPFFGRFRAAWAVAQRLDDLGDVQSTDLIRDSGTTVLVFGQSQYTGIEFTLRVQEVYAETIQD
jgi:hypothetical protein